MAAAYLFHLVKNHAFNDGNKRIAALTAGLFLARLRASSLKSKLPISSEKIPRRHPVRGGRYVGHFKFFFRMRT
ncbi:MAG: Fic family protein [Bdellovibrionales bacterium]|nr:Fic family protein [Bdellovibrionales bacterium]